MIAIPGTADPGGLEMTDHTFRNAVSQVWRAVRLAITEGRESMGTSFEEDHGGQESQEDPGTLRPPASAQRRNGTRI
jgi:hypothetical protein